MQAKLSLPSCFHCVLLSCCRVFGIGVTLKMQNETARSLCTACSAGPTVGSQGGVGRGPCRLRGERGAGRRVGSVSAEAVGFQRLRSTPHGFGIISLVQRRLDATGVGAGGDGEAGEGMGRRLRVGGVGATVPLPEGQGAHSPSRTHLPVPNPASAGSEPFPHHPPKVRTSSLRPTHPLGRQSHRFKVTLSPGQ